MIKNLLKRLGGAPDASKTENDAVLVPGELIDESQLGTNIENFVEKKESSNWTHKDDSDKNISIIPRHSSSELSPFDWVNQCRVTGAHYSVIAAEHLHPLVLKRIYDLEKADCVKRGVQWDADNNYSPQDMRLKDIAIWQFSRFEKALSINKNVEAFYVFETVEEDFNNHGYWIAHRKGNQLFFYFSPGAAIGSHTFVTIKLGDNYHVVVTRSAIQENMAIHSNEFSGCGALVGLVAHQNKESTLCFGIHRKWFRSVLEF